VFALSADVIISRVMVQLNNHDLQQEPRMIGLFTSLRRPKHFGPAEDIDFDSDFRHRHKHKPLNSDNE